MRTLIVDDEENIRRTTIVALESLGHPAIGAESPSTALKLLAQSHFDVVLLDLKLNGESGLEFLSCLLTRYPHLAVVVFTARATMETAMEALRCGAVDCLPKPFTLEHVRQVLAKITRPPADSVRPASVSAVPRESGSEPMAFNPGLLTATGVHVVEPALY